MEQLLLHLFGDFILQDDYTALHKKDKNLNGFNWCYIHAVLYGLPFMLITNWAAVFGIMISHFIFDRWHLVEHFIKFRNGTKDISNFGFSPERPFAVSIWLMIITDNTIHLICNYFAIKYLGGL